MNNNKTLLLPALDLMVFTEAYFFRQDYLFSLVYRM